MKLSRTITAFAFVVALAACQPPSSNTGDNSQAPEDATVADAAPASPCPVSAHGDWQASVRDGSPAALTISGSVELPTPGYAVSLVRDPGDAADTTEPHLSLMLTPPAGMITQVLTSHPVYYFAPATGAYRVVHILCEGQPLTDIAVTPE